MNKDITWLFFDLNSYFASVEQQENPELMGRPIAVVPVEAETTCAIAASYEAKAFGIKTGTIIKEARKLCPNLITVPAHHSLYVDYHHRIIESVAKHIPINKIWSIDELSSHLPPRLRSVEEASKIAHKIKRSLAEDIGPAIRCSIGLAPNSFLAKIASNMQKPDGLIALRRSDLPYPLLSLKLRDLPGIGANMEKRLNLANIHEIIDIWNLQPKQARQIWGSVGGERFWYNLRGLEIPDLPTQKNIIGHSRVLPPQYRTPDWALYIARHLTIKAVHRLRESPYLARDFNLSIRGNINGENYKKWSKSLRLTNPSNDYIGFSNALNELWGYFIAQTKPKFLNKVAISLGNLAQKNQITPDLFSSQTKDNHNKALSTAFDKIHKKYGIKSLEFGGKPERLTPKNQEIFKDWHSTAGTKIAFARVPNKSEFSGE